MKVINQRFTRAALTCLLLLVGNPLHAQVDTPVPHFIAHQGGLSGADATYTGPGKFKFALIVASGPTALWNNDNNTLINNPQTPVTEPQASIALPVTAGGYELFLGTGSSQFIPYSLFIRADVLVRAWFSRTGAAGSFVVQPDIPIPAAAYAMQVPDGTITGPKIAAIAVASAQLANGAVTLGKIGTGAVTSTNLAPRAVAVGNLLTSGAAPTDGQVLGFNGTSLNWTAPTAGPWVLSGYDALFHGDNGGRVGIGTNSPGSMLDVESTTGGTLSSPTIYGSNGASGTGILGRSVSGDGLHGESTSGNGIEGFSKSGTGIVAGSTSGTALYAISSSGGTGVIASSTSGPGVVVTSASGAGVIATSASGMAIVANGNVQQQRDKGGFAKAMIFVKGDGTIIRGFNSNLNGTAANTAPCGFSVQKVGSQQTVIDFGFKVDDRFLSVFPANGIVVGVLYGQGPEGTNPNKIWLSTSSATDMTVILF